MNKVSLLSVLLYFFTQTISAQRIKNAPSYQYDNLGRVIKESYSPECKFITYTYDNDGNRLLESKKYFTFNVAQQNITCQNPTGSITLTPTSTGVYSYQWSSGAAGNTGTNLTQGVNTVTITETGNNNVCTKEFFVFASPSGVANVYGNTSFCQFGNTTLSTDTGIAYLWSNGATTPTITVSDSGFYSVTVTDAQGNCYNSQPVQVNMNLAPVAWFGCYCMDILCVGDSIRLVTDNIPNSVYQWFDNSIPVTPKLTDTTFLWFTTINASIQITDTITGCQSQISPQHLYYVAQRPDSTISIVGNNPFCQNDSLMLFVNSTDTIPGWSYDVFWRTVGDPTPVDFDTLFYATVPGQYYVQIDNSACQVYSDTITVTVSPADTASFTNLPDTVCLSANPITLSGFPYGGSFSGSGMVDSTFTPVAAGTGWHTVTYSYTNLAGCTDTSSKSVYVNGCTGLNDYTSNSIFTLNPNPTDKEATVTFTLTEPSKVTITLLDAKGKLISTILQGEMRQGNNEERVKTDFLKQGTYYICVMSDKNVSTKKLVIQR